MTEKTFPPFYRNPQCPLSVGLGDWIRSMFSSVFPTESQHSPELEYDALIRNQTVQIIIFL